VFHASFDAAGEKQRLGDFLDGLLAMVRGETVATCEEELRSFSVRFRELEVGPQSLQRS
jgi:hypothetical protein